MGGYGVPPTGSLTSSTEHTFSAPLDRADPTSGPIEVFAREVVAAGRQDDDLPWLLFLQGGPGVEATRPLRRHTPDWLDRALQELRVLLLEQRETGRSSPVGPNDVVTHGAAGLAARLVHFRADSIVRDAEQVRRELGVEQWAGGARAELLDRSIDEVYTATYRRTADKVARHYARYPADRARVRSIVARLTAAQLKRFIGVLLWVIAAKIAWDLAK